MARIARARNALPRSVRKYVRNSPNMPAVTRAKGVRKKSCGK